MERAPRMERAPVERAPVERAPRSERGPSGGGAAAVAADGTNGRLIDECVTGRGSKGLRPVCFLCWSQIPNSFRIGLACNFRISRNALASGFFTETVG